MNNKVLFNAVAFIVGTVLGMGTAVALTPQQTASPFHWHETAPKQMHGGDRYGEENGDQIGHKALMSNERSIHQTAIFS